MAKLQDDSQPRVDISLPNVISPKPGGIYDSPVPFELRPGSGGALPGESVHMPHLLQGARIRKFVGC